MHTCGRYVVAMYVCIIDAAVEMRMRTSNQLSQVLKCQLHVACHLVNCYCTECVNGWQTLKCHIIIYLGRQRLQKLKGGCLTEIAQGGMIQSYLILNKMRLTFNLIYRFPCINKIYRRNYFCFLSSKKRVGGLNLFYRDTFGVFVAGLWVTSSPLSSNASMHKQT